jgi:tRNA-dihydrouridine synthase A
VFEAGADGLWVHARKAWLQGLSPRENRDIPPLDHPLVYRLKRDFANRFIGLNGGIATLDQAGLHLEHVDGVMLGRAAYQTPAILAGVDAMMAGEISPELSTVVDAMARYADRHIGRGGRLHHVTRHMSGLFHGFPGARQYRRMLAEEATGADSGAAVLAAAAVALERRIAA